MKPKEPSKKSPHKKLILAVAILLGIGLLGWLAYSWYQSATVNYAQEAARPLEDALVKAGAVKVCSNGDAGLGPDNRKPWVYELYEISGDKNSSIALIQNAAKESGFSLSPATSPANLENNSFYSDNSTKKNPYTGLKDGYIELIAEVYGSKAYSGDISLCTVKTSSSSSNKTTLDITINLPERK
jgi:hypothetical protein